MLDTIDVEECLADLPSIDVRDFWSQRRVDDLAPYRRVATAIDGDPREAKGVIYAIGDSEFLVPETRERDYRSSVLTSNTVHLDQAKRITDRPNGTRDIRKMAFSTDIAPSDLSLLKSAVEQWNPPDKGYAVTIISPL